MINKILIDNSNLFAGGGIQVATSFLNDLKDMDTSPYVFHVIQSYNSSKAIDKTKFPKEFIFYDLEESLSKVKKIQYVKEIENKVKPNCIFTTFGPSYHKSNFPKIVGFAFGQMIYKDSPFYKKLSFLQRLKYEFVIFMKKEMFLKNSDVLIFETDDAKFKFNRLTHNKKISYTVNNTLNTIFTTPNDWKDFKINKVGLNILCLTANYLHKNLDIIPRVIDQLLTMDNDLDFKFFISLEKKDLRFDDKYDRYISYLGRVELENLPILYLQMNILFMPTLLETFSTTYLEAMFMKVPIVASDMSFARDICGEAALYCSPLNEKDYAEKILLLYNNKELKNSLISKGQKELKRFGDSISRTKRYLEIIKKTSNENKK